MATIDHLVYAVADLAAAVDWFEQATGTRPAIGGAHEGLGTHNALVSCGDCYLELIAPDPDQRDPNGPRPFGIDALDGPGLVGFAVRPGADDSIDGLAERCLQSGYDTGPVANMSRTTPDGVRLSWRLTMPTQPSLPFLIEWGNTPKPNTTAPGGIKLVDFVVHTPHIASTASALEALGLTLRVEHAHTTALRATVSGPGGTAEL